MQRIRTTDISGVCNPSISLCTTGSNNPFGYGYQENYFSKKVSTSSFSANSPIKIEYAECCISGQVNNLLQTNFFLEASFYKGYSMNEGPVFAKPLSPVFIVGVPNYYNAGITNENGDSVVYELSHPSRIDGTPYPYYTPYTYNKPFQYSGNSVFALTFDQTTRQLKTGSNPYVVPSTTQMPMLSYTISRYRGGLLIGKSQVFHAIAIVPNSASNNTPVVSTSATSLRACAGSNLCVNLYTSDPNTGDSTYLFMDNSNLPGVAFVSNNQKNATGTFCWTPNVSHVRTEPYYFTFRTRDNSCPKTLESFTTIAVKVDSSGGTIQASPSVTYNYCTGKVDFQAGLNSGPGNYQYNWVGAGGVNSGTSNFSHTYTQSGWKPYTLRISSPQACGDFIRNDSLWVPSFVPVSASIFNRTDTMTCEGMPLVLIPHIKGGQPPFAYSWNNGQSSANSFTFAGINPDTIYLKATDSFGCESNSMIRIGIRKNPAVAITGGDKTLCIGSIGFALTADKSNGVWSGSSCINTPLKLFVPYASCLGANDIIYTYADTYGCIGRDTVVYTVTDKIKSDAGTYTSVCATTGFVQLNGTPAGGTWFGDSVRLNKFYPSQIKVGLNQLIYRSPLSCSEDDTTYLEVLSAPPVSIQVPDSFCSNVAQATLIASPAGGSWFGNHILNDKFNLQTAGAGKHEIAYYYYSPPGCLTSNSKWITVQAAPTVSAGTDLTVCKNSGTINLNATPIGGQWSGPLVSSGKFNSDSAIGGTYTNVYQYSSGVCNLRDTMKIHLLEAGFNAAVVSGNAPLTVNFTNTSSTGFDYYSWVFGDPGSGLANISTQINPSHTYNNQGVYQVKLTAGNTASACTHAVTKNAYIVVGPNGVNNVFLSEAFTVFPNPAKEGRVNVLLTHADGSLSSYVQLFDVSGRMLKIYHPVINEPLEIDGLSRGVYFLKAVIGDGSVQVKKLIVQ
ncbi:MAG: T9SS type A sorting domain-containing protein [Bacteroidia bacterium]